MTESKGIVGVVLAGGAGSRLGQDKCSLHFPFADGEQDMLTRTVRLLCTVVHRVCVIGREYKDCLWFLDDVPGMGPVGGIASALRRLNSPCLVMPVDMPFMNAKTLNVLLSAHVHRRSTEWVTCFRHVNAGYIQPLAAVYEPDILSIFQKGVKEDKVRLDRLIPNNRVHCVPYATEEALPFFSINYPADVHIVKMLLCGAVECPSISSNLL